MRGGSKGEREKEIGWSCGALPRFVSDFIIMRTRAVESGG